MNTPANRIQVFQHLRERALERYGLEITRRKLAQVRRAITGGEWMCVAVQANGAQHLVGKIDGILVRLVWDPKEDVIVTFLPLNSSVARSRL